MTVGEERELGRLSGKVEEMSKGLDKMTALVDDVFKSHEDRIDSLESSRDKRAGAARLAGFAWGSLIGLVPLGAYLLGVFHAG